MSTQCLIIYSIHNSKQQYAAQEFAVRHINNDSALLPNYKLQLKPQIAANDSEIMAFKHAMSLINKTTSSLVTADGCIIIHIVLGCPYSGMSIMTTPALNAFNFAMISSSATAIRLSNTHSFEYFYRTVPDDSIQAKAIIQLLKHEDANKPFWDQILIMHDNDAYGVGLAIELLELCTKHGIGVNSISYEGNDPISMDTAASSIQDLEVYIVVLIAHGADLRSVINTLKDKDMWNYPWYYIGVDGWMNPSHFEKQNVSTETAGSIGTVPWQPGHLSFDYKGNMRNIYNQSQGYSELISKIWENQYYKDASFVDHRSRPGSWAPYQWDSVYAIAHTLHTFDDIYNLSSIFNGSMTSAMVVNALDDIIVNKINFVGATGTVTFHPTGNREYGIYSYGNARLNGEVLSIGYYINENTYKIDTDKIVLPSGFDKKWPRSTQQTTYKLITINSMLFAFVTVLVVMSTLMVIFFMFSIIRFRKHPVVKAGSWKLNILVCVGCLLAYGAILLHGATYFTYPDGYDMNRIDEHQLKGLNSDHDIAMMVACNTRIWLLCVAFTLIFMPLFMKTYRLALIFRSFKIETRPDSTLMIGIAICLCVDVLLLSIFTGIAPLKRQYEEGSILMKESDALELRQNIYGVCSTDYTLLLHLILGLWKAAELIFGIYVAAIVSRIGLKKLITKFDETGQQILAITFTVFVMTIMVPYLLASIESDQIDWRYGMVSCCIAITCNVSAIVNILPRIYALYYSKIKKDDRKLRRFDETFEETVLNMIRTQIRQFQQSLTGSNVCLRCRTNSDLNDNAATDTSMQTQAHLGVHGVCPPINGKKIDSKPTKSDDSTHQSDPTNNDTLTCSAPYSHNDSKEENACILHDLEDMQCKQSFDTELSVLCDQ
eukprot:759154_1